MLLIINYYMFRFYLNLVEKSPQPGIEPGSKPPEGLMLPLHHWG
jgi:hypothetical protein